MEKPYKLDPKMPFYEERKKNWSLRTPGAGWLRERGIKTAYKVFNESVDKHARNPDGSIDARMYDLLFREVVIRRGSMGPEIDFHEPARAALYLGAIGIGGGTAAKMLETYATKHQKPKPSATKDVLIGVAIASVIATCVQLGRIVSLARFKAGLYGGVQTALQTHHAEQAGIIRRGDFSGLPQKNAEIPSPAAQETVAPETALSPVHTLQVNSASLDKSTLAAEKAHIAPPQPRQLPLRKSITPSAIQERRAMALAQPATREF